MNLLLPAVIVMGVMGAIFGIGLAFAGRRFAVEQDPRVTRVRAALSGANCGACGFPGCDGLAEAIVRGEAPLDACKPAGAKGVLAIAEIMGASSDGIDDARRIAQVKCAGGHELAVERSDYRGIQDCKAADMAGHGSKACIYGCLGFGTCVKACPFDAMTMGEDGIPVVDAVKCTGCGKCVTACPRKIIELADSKMLVHVRCKNHDKGAVVRKTCKVGCIACQICVKECPTGAMKFDGSLAYIDYALCTNCGICAEKCPVKAISDDSR